MNRINSISTSRVVATLFIVVCHVIKYYTFIPWHDHLGELFNVGVPMFIIISGYLYGMKFCRAGGGKFNYGHFIWRRLMKVSIPVQLFAIALLVVLGTEQLRSSVIAILNLQGVGYLYKTHFFDAGMTLGHTWFVTVIIICYILTPLIGKAIQNNYLTNYSMGCLWVLTFIVPFEGIYLCFITLYITSYYVAAKGLSMRFSKILLLIVMALALVGRIGGKLMYDDTILYDKVIVYITHFALATSIVLLIRELSRNESLSHLCENKVHKFLDDNSYYIYIVHYCLIPPIYEYWGWVTATVFFVALTLIISVVLKFAHQLILKIIGH